jgi:hypothetical protein
MAGEFQAEWGPGPIEPDGEWLAFTPGQVDGIISAAVSTGRVPETARGFWQQQAAAGGRQGADVIMHLLAAADTPVAASGSSELSQDDIYGLLYPTAEAARAVTEWREEQAGQRASRWAGYHPGPDFWMPAAAAERAGSAEVAAAGPMDLDEVYARLFGWYEP